MKYTIEMRSKADSVKGQGVGSATEEAIQLLKNGLPENFELHINQKGKANIIHFHTINPGYFLSTFYLKGKRDLVCSVHFLPETVDNSLRLPRLFKKVFYWYMIRFYKRMDYLVTVNPDFITRLEHYGIDRDKVWYIPNFVDENAFYPICLEQKEQLRRSYHLDPKKFTVVAAGQLQVRKGIWDFLRVAEKLPHMQFVWAGGFSFGRISDGYDSLKQVVDSPPDNVTFLGIVDREKMNEVYNLGDVMFLPSYEELFPMTILEAMNCNLPILLRDLPLYRPILDGYYVEGHDTDAFIEILTRLQDDSSYYEQVAARSWQGHLFYNSQHVLSMWQEFYSAIAEKKNDSAKIKNKKETL